MSDLILNLSGNQITEVKGLPDLTNLRVLDLSRNSISSIKPFAVINLPSLTHLHLDRNCLNNIDGIESLNTLNYCNLQQNKFSNNIIQNAREKYPNSLQF